MPFSCEIYPEEHFRLWWEYLRRHKDLKRLCDLARTEENKNKPWRWRNLPNQLIHVHRIYREHGDIFDQSYNEWRQERTQDPYSNIIFEYSDFLKHQVDVVIKALERNLGRKPSIDEFQEDFSIHTDCFNDRLFIINPYLLPPAKVTARIKDKTKRPGYRKPLIRYDDLQTYLDVYDLFESGCDIHEVIRNYKTTTPGSGSEYDPSRTENADTLQREYRRYRQNADRIIRNIEADQFPGNYSD